jgi:hypothetical protein
MSFFGKRILAAVAAVGFGCMVASSASAATTTVAWDGNGSFNNATYMFTPNAFMATSFTGITGLGLYSGCCSNGTATDFTLSLKLGTDFVDVATWSVPGTFFNDNFPQLMSGLNLSYNFGSEMLVSGIKLSSNPPGTPNSDRNFTLFEFGPFNTTFFHFNNDPNEVSGPGETPLPAALPLMATVLFGAGAAAWRRRRRNAANIAA